jgi:hypothetical protein
MKKNEFYSDRTEGSHDPYNRAAYTRSKLREHSARITENALHDLLHGGVHEDDSLIMPELTTKSRNNPPKRRALGLGRTTPGLRPGSRVGKPRAHSSLR